MKSAERTEMEPTSQPSRSYESRAQCLGKSARAMLQTSGARQRIEGSLPAACTPSYSTRNQIRYVGQVPSPRPGPPGRAVRPRQHVASCTSDKCEYGKWVAVIHVSRDAHTYTNAALSTNLRKPRSLICIIPALLHAKLTLIPCIPSCIAHPPLRVAPSAHRDLRDPSHRG